MNRYVLNILTKDQPGIVAGVSTAVGNLDGSIISCSQTVLHGYFTLISIVEFPKEYEPNDLVRQMLQQESIGNGYLISAAKMDDRPASARIARMKSTGSSSPRSAMPRRE